MKIDLKEPWTGRVAVDSICRNPDQPRVTFDSGGLARLGKALRKRQQQPCRVIPHKDPNNSKIRWMLVDGERRWRAARSVKMENLWVCYEPGVDHENIHESSLAANFNREGHTKMDTARALQKELDQGKAVDELAELVGWSETNVRNYLDLLKLHPEIQEMLDHRDKDRRLPLRVAIALARFPKEKQRKLYDLHVAGKREGDAITHLRVHAGGGASPRRDGGEDNRFVIRRIQGALTGVSNINQLEDMIAKLSPDKAAEALVILEKIRHETTILKLRIEKHFPA